MESASSDSVPVDDIKDLLTCSMCSKTLNDPRILPCLHNFCKVCLGKYLERLRGGDDKTIEVFPCPTCRSEFTIKSNQDVADLTCNHFIENMLEIMAVQEKAKMSATCFRCQDPAINHCAYCDLFMCKKCTTELHDVLPSNKSHLVLSIGELDIPESQAKMKSKLYCKKHKDKIVEYYCETCKELSCIHCVVLNHQKQNHSCVEMSELGEKQRETLQSSCTTLDEKLSEGKKALNNICEVMKSLEKNAKTTKDQIKAQKENIIKILVEKLDEKTKKLNEDVDKAYDEMHSQLSKQHDEIKEYLDKVQASLSLPRNLLKRGSVAEILSSQKSIDEKVEKLRNEKPEDLDAVNDVDIKYVPNDIGKINVDEIVGQLGHVEDCVSATNKLKTSSSSILKGKIALVRKLNEWLGEKCKWNLCYRGSRDGRSAQDFHRHCDNKGPTVVLVKANDCIFGGFTDQHWDSGNRYKSSKSSFLFSLRNKDNLAPFIANIKQGQEQHAIYCFCSYGPTFGGGHDLYICNFSQTNRSLSSNFGHTYQLPPGYVYGSEQAKNLLVGRCKFKTTEIEVFN